jgi:hypothetical protein
MNMFPKTGETWAPALPWPTDECPAGFYVHRFGADGRTGFTFGILGRADLFRADERPEENARAVAEACGSAGSGSRANQWNPTCRATT